jgi:myo-inositol-1(or 4)-monophosphatase
MNVMLRAVEKAGKSLVRDFGEVEQLQVSIKGPGDFVSAADHRSEKILFEELSKARPDFGFLMEESGTVTGKDADYKWIIDPLDGTTNFLHGIPHWCINLALEKNGEVIAGVTYDPIKDELFRAEKGDGAFMRNKRLRVSGRKDLALSVIGLGGPGPKRRTDRKTFLSEVNAALIQTAGFRRSGSAALDMAYVAAGRLDAYWEDDLSPWDIAAGIVIIREAGGFVGTLNGKGNPVYDGDVLATNANLQEPVRKMLTNAAGAVAVA